MASRGGPTVDGTDGSDFLHRERVASHYKASASYKARLKIAIFFHGLLFIAMCAKVAEDVLDRLDIFILALEELYIPKPMLWEWIWLGASLPTAFMGLSAVRKNTYSTMKFYVIFTTLFGFCPVLFAASYYLSDVLNYVTGSSEEPIEIWQGFPVGILWYIFVALALQIHGFSLFFGIKLMRAWQQRISPRKLN